jgi:arsenite-transporting ATPase
VPGVPGLAARQLDAERSWRAFRDRYRSEAGRLFAGVVAGGAGTADDRRVVQRLLDLAPPGLDELVALVQVVDLTGDRPYDALVLDAAPTGHLLRLLELPGVALRWTHAVLRMLLKYREVVGLGDLAEGVLELARDLRALQERLRDPEGCWLLAVALPEALSVPESARLLAGLRALGMRPGALLVNRLLDPAGRTLPGRGARAAELIGVAAGLPVAAAPERPESPVGPRALRAFAREWRAMRT